MAIDLDTFLVALYTIVDDLYQQHAAPAGAAWPGPPPTVADSEVLTGCAPKRAFLRYVEQHWRAYFPRVLSQSAYNRRCRDLAGVLVAFIPLVAQELQAVQAAYEAVDTVAVPLLRRCRGRSQRLFADEAAFGRGGSDKEWYYGCKLLLAVTPGGVVTGFCSPRPIWRSCRRPAVLAGGSASRPWHALGPTGPRWPPTGASGGPYIADDGFFGAWWALFIDSPDRRDDQRPPDAHLWLTLPRGAQQTRPADPPRGQSRHSIWASGSINSSAGPP